MTNSRKIPADIDAEMFKRFQEIRGHCEVGNYDPKDVLEKLRLIIDNKVVSPPFRAEENPSTVSYPSGFRFKTVAEQLEVLRGFRLFEKLDSTQVESQAGIWSAKADQWTKAESEGILVVPKHTSVAASYGEATRVVLDLLTETRPEWHCVDGVGLGEDRLRLYKQASDYYHHYYHPRPGDFLVTHAQLGVKHRGRSSRRAIACLANNEWALDPYAVLITLLTHPERLTGLGQLNIHCAGAEYAPYDGFFGGNLRISFREGLICLDWGWQGDALEDFGSPSGFLIY